MCALRTSLTPRDPSEGSHVQEQTQTGPVSSLYGSTVRETALANFVPRTKIGMNLYFLSDTTF